MKQLIYLSVLIPFMSFGAIGDLISGVTNSISSAVTDAQMLKILKAKYERDMASGISSVIASWHGPLTKQVLDSTNGVMRLIYSDGYEVNRTYQPKPPATVSAAKSLSVLKKAYEAQLKQAEKELEALHNGVPKALLEQKIESLKARLNDGIVTNVTVEVGGGMNQ